MPKNAKCVVPHCGHAHQKNKACTFARFPRQTDRCKEWVRTIGVKDLLHLSVEKLNAIRYVCGCHFTVDQFMTPSKKKLKDTAVPSVFDPRVIALDDGLLENFPLSDVIKIPTAAKTVQLSHQHLEGMRLNHLHLNKRDKLADTVNTPSHNNEESLFRVTVDNHTQFFSKTTEIHLTPKHISNEYASSYVINEENQSSPLEQPSTKATMIEISQKESEDIAHNNTLNSMTPKRGIKRKRYRPSSEFYIISRQDVKFAEGNWLNSVSFLDAIEWDAHMERNINCIIEEYRHIYYRTYIQPTVKLPVIISQFFKVRMEIRFC
ncbi:uncharacterized protein LOC107045685 [Diachasma alloeum]|uniref:uncharacterized protein LOC107045685 n=1 Tax=Diachasma alloeum TaxID=454923 RepID=UPI0007382533|nr:uncharacterized protein LOC107045685 [Diachasma alloeum]